MSKYVQQIYCTLDDCLSSAKITGVENIKVDGKNGLSNTKIISQVFGTFDNDNNVLKIYIENNNTVGNIDIICNATDICKIVCLAPNACTVVNIYCQGICIVKCDPNEGIDCPPYGNYTILGNTTSPTEIPTQLPTITPTYTPSYQPSIIPTAIPTIVPSYIPTYTPSIPTTIPSNTPSIIPSNINISFYVPSYKYVYEVYIL